MLKLFLLLVMTSSFALTAKGTPSYEHLIHSLRIDKGFIPPPAPQTLFLKTSLDVKDVRGRVYGHLELWADAKLRADPRHGGSIAMNDEEELYHLPKLIYVDAEDHTIAEEELERPVAEISATPLEGEGRVFGVMVDHSIGMGSYNGPITSFVRLKPGMMEWVMRAEPNKGKPYKLQFMNSMKSYWKIKDPRTILAATCRPNFKENSDGSESNDFEMTFYRFYWDGKKWPHLTKKRPGYSDFEMEIDPKDFP